MGEQESPSHRIFPRASSFFFCLSQVGVSSVGNELNQQSCKKDHKTGDLNPEPDTQYPVPLTPGIESKHEP